MVECCKLKPFTSAGCQW